MKKIDVWKWAQRIAVLAGLLYLGIDNIILRTTINNKLENIITNDKTQNEYIQNQNEINGKFIILYDYFITGSTRPRAEEEENP